MMDAQESHEDDEEYEDPQREFATPAGSQAGDANDVLGALLYYHLLQYAPLPDEVGGCK